LCYDLESENDNLGKITTNIYFLKLGGEVERWREEC